MEEHVPIRRHRLPDLHSYDVTGDELDQIEREAMQVGLDFSFASIALTAFISFLLALTTTEIKVPWVFEAYFSVMLSAFGFAVFFGIRWVRGRKVGTSIITKIRQRQVGPLGNEAREIQPADLENLPAQVPDSKAPTT